MKNIIRNTGILASILFLLNFQEVQAQIGPPPEENVPIDGGASLLAAAGVAYGVKKYRDHRKNSSDQEDDI